MSGRPAEYISGTTPIGDGRPAGLAFRAVAALIEVYADEQGLG
jgi:hypothetical protein